MTLSKYSWLDALLWLAAIVLLLPLLVRFAGSVWRALRGVPAIGTDTSIPTAGNTSRT